MEEKNNGETLIWDIYGDVLTDVTRYVHLNDNQIQQLEIKTGRGKRPIEIEINLVCTSKPIMWGREKL